MRKLLLLLSLCALGTHGLKAQKVQDYFIHMPDSICPLLTAVNRADFIDFMDSRMKAEVTNRLGGKSQMTERADDYLRIQLTPQNSWQLKLLPMPDGTRVLCAVSTANAPAADSHLRFYTTDWTELPTDSLLPGQPGIDDFLTAPPDSDLTYTYRDARRQADIRFLKADLKAGSDTLYYSLDTPAYMSAEAARTLRPYVRPVLPYVWHAGRFARP